MSRARTSGFGDREGALVAALLAISLHLLVLMIPGHPTQKGEDSPQKDLRFHLENPPRVAPAPQNPETPKGDPNPPETPKDARKERKMLLPPPHPAKDPRPVQEPAPAPTPKQTFSRGQLSQQISEVSESLVREKAERLKERRLVHAAEAKNHPAILQAYESAFKAKIEQIGNLNYPEGALKEHLSGKVRVAVAIEPNGTPYSIRILESSKIPVLDEGAIRIVRLSAPFAPLPAELLEEMDILVITKTWHFDDQAHFSTR